ncbi:GntR family transcriptional regulator [Natronohydrobacter thiooxidans]|uniref:GntR family transcriptional regulator n=1 Tax=Natronohydrobacter thiooxidans TaxID=87172 RepID=UPI0008FF2EBF|nr:GntR family transcriptional regulator [Natronohydrobacter thiooxidans]
MSKDTLPFDWKAIRRDVLEQIQSGQWKPGDKIPREIELAAHYDCTRSTVGRALRDLATAGFLERRRKGGTIVAANPTRKAPLEVPILREAIRAAGSEPGYRLLQAGPERAPEEIAAKLGLPPGGELLHVLALYLADGAAHQIEDRWLVPAMVRGLDPDHLRSQPVDEWLLHNAPLTRAKIEIEAIALPAGLAHHFDQPAQSPSLLVTRVSWRQSKPIGLLRLYHAAGQRLKTGI